MTMSLEVSELVKGVKVKEKTLVVESFNHLNKMSKSVERFSESNWAEINQWGEANQFLSMKKMSIDLSDAFSLVNSQKLFDEFMSKYDGIVEITKNNSIEVKDYFYSTRRFLKITLAVG